MRVGSFEQLEPLVIKWAENRGLLKPENALVQYTKVVEEVSEIGTAVALQNQDKIIDALGDTLVTLIIISKQLGYSLEDCLHVAYNEIKDRTGQTVNGTFVKDGSSTSK